MSFLKKIAPKLRKRRGEASEDTNKTSSSLKQEVSVRGKGSQHDEEHLSQQGNPISISGGTFNSAGRDIINQYLTEGKPKPLTAYNRKADVYHADSKDSKLFELLNPVPAAHDCEVVSSKVSECFTGTRQQLLHDIETWRTTGSVPIFILDGIAGIGKSTIVKTVCAQASFERRLAASWFFSRDEQDRKTTRGFVRTMAYQLATYHPALRDRISQVLKTQPDILQKAIRMQFEALIHEPLRGVFEDQSQTHTISLDAIDECNLTEAVELLSILLTTIPQHPSLRLLVTCRPERPFRLLLQKHHGPRALFHLHEIEKSVAEADIRLYINHCLSPAQIDEALPDLLPPPWRASHEEKEALVQMAGKLFIVASTAVNFVLDPLRLAPGKQMAQLLDVEAGAALAGSSMDRLYIQVLRAAVPEPVGDWFEDYQAIVGSIVVAADLLSVHSLASLLNMEPNDIVRTLSHLHSLIAPARDSDAFHVHHKSFPDFVTDKSRCAVDSRFFLEVSSSHLDLARNCLRIMIRMLKQNILDLPRSDWDVEAKDLPPSTKGRILPELSYACAYWTVHLQEGLPHLVGDNDIIGQLMIFVDQYLLSWMEVLAWTNRFDTAWGNISLLLESIEAQLLPVAGDETLAKLTYVTSVLRDLLRFISLHPEIPRSLPMHIYISALPFAPSESEIRCLYAKLALNTTQPITVVSGLEQHWNPISVAFEESSRVNAMALSRCGTMVATRAGRVHLYNAKSGQLLQSLGSEEEGFVNYSVAFSQDSRCIAATSQGGVQVWDVVSGELVGNCRFPPSSTQLLSNSSSKYTIHSEDESCSKWDPNILDAISLIFNPGGLSITAGTMDGRLLLWQIGQPEAVLLLVGDTLNRPCGCLPEETRAECLAHSITTLVAPPDSPVLVGVAQSGVHFWDRDTHKYLKVILRCAPAPFFGPVSVSLDKKLLAIDCDPSVISIHSVHTQHRLCRLSGHQGRVTTTAFAPLSWLCSASEDRTLRLWDIATASQLKCIETAYALRSAIFSARLGTFVLAGQGRMVRLAGDECTPFGPGHFLGASSRLAADGSVIASYLGTSIMVTNVQDFIGTVTHIDSHELSQPPTFGHLSSGEVVALYFDDELEIPLKMLEGAASLNVIIRESTFGQISHDMSRVAIFEGNAGVRIYNIRSGRQEVRLTLPLVDAEYESPHRNRVGFSWDSSTVYWERPGDKFYAACLPPASESRQEVPLSQLAFSRIEDTPSSHFEWLNATGLPHGNQLHLLAHNCALVLLNDEKTWTRTHLPSLPFKDIHKIAYSPSGLFIALATLRSKFKGTDIQIRSLPDYNLIEILRDQPHSNWIRELSFIDHLPHILVACSPLGFTCWDAKNRQSLGNSYSLSYRGDLESVHPYNGSDFLCLMKSHSALLVLIAVQLRGPDLPGVVQQLCFFPPHLSVLSKISVNPCRPHIVALSTRNGIIQLDISKCPLPFAL